MAPQGGWASFYGPPGGLGFFLWPPRGAGLLFMAPQGGGTETPLIALLFLKKRGNLHFSVAAWGSSKWGGILVGYPGGCPFLKGVAPL
jgi:hypothetical protein